MSDRDRVATIRQTAMLGVTSATATAMLREIANNVISVMKVPSAMPWGIGMVIASMTGSSLAILDITIRSSSVGLSSTGMATRAC
jgi:hypothetical protein